MSESLLFADSPDTSRKGWFFLACAILFLVFLKLLPSQVVCLGLFGEAIGFESAPHHLTAAAGLGLLFLCCHLSLDLLLRQEGWEVVLSGWPRGALRRVQWLRLSAMACIGFCLSNAGRLWEMQSALAIIFLVVLLQFFRDARRMRVQNLRRLGDFLGDLRLCWFSLILGSYLFHRSGLPSPQEVTFSLLLLVFSLGLQIHPRLSFALCFFEAKATQQFTMERCLWQIRLERIMVGVLALASLSHPDLLTRLAPFCAGRVFFLLALRQIYSDPRWTGLLRSELGPWSCFTATNRRAILPDQASRNAFFPWSEEPTRPVDRFGDGPLVVPLWPPREKVSYLPRPVSLEAVLAGLLLVVGFASAARNDPVPAEYRPRMTYQTRAVATEHGVALYHSSTEPGPLALLEDLPYPVIMVETQEEATVLTMMTLIVILFACYFRWRLTLLGMWGISASKADYSSHLYCLSSLAAIGVAAQFEWLWFPSEPVFLCFAALAMQRPLRFSPRILKSVSLQTGGLFAAPKLERWPTVHHSNHWQELIRTDDLTIEIGRGLFPLVDPRIGQPLVKSDLPHLFRKRTGFVLPPVRFRDNLQLSELEYRLLIKNVNVAKGKAHLAQIFDGRDFVGADSVARRIEREMLEHLVEHAELFVTTSAVVRILNSATWQNQRLVDKVRERHSPTSVKRALKGLIARGYSLTNPQAWLPALAEANGSPEQFSEQIVKRAELRRLW